MLDKFTEIVAHMIGIFHTTLEAERMRDAYAEFKFKQINSSVNELEPGSIHFTLRYTLKNFDPELKYTPLSSDAPFAIWSTAFARPNFPEPYLPPGEGLSLDFHRMQPAAPFFSPGRPLLQLEPPGSVAVVSAQSAWMQDDDLLRLNSVHAEFTNPTVYTAILHDLHAVAQTLGVLSDRTMWSISADGEGSFIELYDLMGETHAAARIGETVTVLHGSEAYGMFVNGTAVDALPLLEELLPELLQDEDADEDSEAGLIGEEGQDVRSQIENAESIQDTDAFRSLNPPSEEAELFGLESGHQIVTGGNMMLNEVIMNVSWLDAPVISVMGDVVDLNSISQVNVLAEYATFDGVGQDSLSATFNIAMMSYTSSNPLLTESDEIEASNDSAKDAYVGFPKNWAVTRIDGDLLTINWVQQYSFMTDHDRADVMLTGSNTYIGLGENNSVNLLNLAEIGYGYDLIMVGGDLISVNQISQMNLMLDHDAVTLSGSVEEFGDSVSGNLLFNGASISTVGINTYGAMSANFAAASKAFSEGAQTIDSTVAHDGAFAGDELLTVLYIDGDFKTINWVEQTNILGDSDQIHLALGNFLSQTGVPLELHAGSNAEINSASINLYGADSEVRVQGEVYSDALLYQAELIDTTADPTGVSLPALANEAVAFLADDMTTASAHPSDDFDIVPTSPESLASPDLMQTMLA